LEAAKKSRQPHAVTLAGARTKRKKVTEKSVLHETSACANSTTKTQTETNPKQQTHQTTRNF
jgi:hypothetical protein